MEKSGLEFKVRHWTDNKDIATQFDVIALDHDTNRQHYQPGVEFSTEALAEQHKVKLEERIKNNPVTINFIKDCWPCDGGIN